MYIKRTSIDPDSYTLTSIKKGDKELSKEMELYIIHLLKGSYGSDN